MTSATADKGLFDPFREAVDKIDALAKDVGSIPSDMQEDFKGIGEDIKIVVAGVADIVEHFLSEDLLGYLGEFKEAIIKALNTLLDSPHTVRHLLDKVEKAFKNVTEGQAAIARVEEMAKRCDGAAMALAERSRASGTASLFASDTMDARLMTERDAVMAEAMEVPGLASSYGLDAHLSDFAADLATGKATTEAELHDELALVSAVRQRTQATSVGVSVAGSISTGGDVSAYVGIGGSIGVGLSKYLANVDARLHRYETLLRAAQKQAA